MAEAPTVVVGQKVNATTKIWPKSAKVAYKSSDETIATVDANGEVTGVKAGKATITATMTCGTKIFDRTTEVTVTSVLLESVKQTKFNTLEAVVYGDTSGIKAQSITVTNKDTNAVAAVQSVSVDGTDATKVIITTYASLTDGKVYTVTLDGVTKEFTATDGKVADVGVSPLQITAGAAGAVVRAQLLDKNQVVVEEYKLDDSLPGKVDYSITSGNGYVAGDKLVLPEVGNTATAKVTYHTFTYDAAGNDTGLIEKTFTITAVDNAATISNWNYTITKDAAVNWKGNVKVVTELATNDTRYAHFYFVDSNKDDVTDQYSVESSDNSILLLAETQLTNVNKRVSVTGVNTGTAYINVKQNGKVVKSLPVTVKAARKLTDIKFVKNVLYSSKANGDTISDETYVMGYDQYNEVLKLTLVSGKILSAPSAEMTHVKNTEIGLGNNAALGFISLSAEGFEKGDYLVEVTAKDDYNNFVTRTITLKAVDTDNISDSQIVYKMNLSQTEVDLAVASNLTTSDTFDVAKTLNIKFVKTKGGAPIDTVDVDTVTVKNPIGVAVTTGASINTLSLNLVTLGGDVVTKNSTYGRMGTYSVQAEYNDGTKVHKFNSSFTLKDTQTKAVVDVKKTTDTGVSTINDANASQVETLIKTLLADTSIADFFYDGEPQTITSTEISVPVTSGSKLNGRALYIGTVNVQIITTGGLKVTVPVDVNKTFTLNSAS